MRNRESIFVKGQRLFLYERNAKDVLDMVDFINKKESFDSVDSVFLNTQMIIQSLKLNLNELKWFQFLKRYKLNKMFTYKYISQNLSVREITEISLTVSSLENQDLKKKVVSESEERSQVG